jgi:hypothetical protein
MVLTVARNQFSGVDQIQGERLCNLDVLQVRVASYHESSCESLVAEDDDERR